LTPPDNRQQLAEDFPSHVRDFLRKQEKFKTTTPHTLLAGSYAQHLTICNIKDVDILVFLKYDPKDGLPVAKQTINDLKAALEGLKDNEDGLNGWIVRNVEIQGNRRSVTVTFADHDFQLDVVPVAAPDGTDSPLFIPDRGFGKWVETHPLGVVKLIRELDEEYSGKVRRLGKVFKAWRNFTMTYMKPKSYWLTSLLLHHVQNTLDMSKTIPLLFRDLAKAIYDDFKPTLDRSTKAPAIPDPMLGHNVAHSWERNDFESFMRHLDAAISDMDRAIEKAGNSDLEGAVEICQKKLFGSEYFPANVDDEIKASSARAMPGASFVTPAGTLVVQSTSKQRATLVPETKFYGSDSTD
jgi:hypothetical protein